MVRHLVDEKNKLTRKEDDHDPTEGSYTAKHDCGTAD